MTYDQVFVDPSGEDVTTTTTTHRRKDVSPISRISGHQRFRLTGIQTTWNMEPENRWNIDGTKIGT